MRHPPASPAVYVPVAFRSERGSWTRRSAISPPVEYHVQKAACMYLRWVSENQRRCLSPIRIDTQADLQTCGRALGIGRGDGKGLRRIEPRLPVGILDRQRLGPRLALRLGHLEADVAQRGSRLGLQTGLVQPELVRSDLVESDGEIVEDLGVGVDPTKLLKGLDRGVWNLSGSRNHGKGLRATHRGGVAKSWGNPTRGSRSARIVPIHGDD
jgi:hypothetical protein